MWMLVKGSPKKLAPCSIIARAVGKDRVQGGSGVVETSATLVEKLRELGVRRLQGFKQDGATARTRNDKLHVGLLTVMQPVLLSFAHCISFVISLWSRLSAGIATLYCVDGPGIESRWGGENFRTRPERPWGPPSLLYKGYRVFTGVKRPGRGVDQPPHLAPRLRKK
jgi:hypothetical protein